MEHKIGKDGKYPASVNLSCINRKTKNRYLSEQLLGILISRETQLDIEKNTKNILGEPGYQILYVTETTRKLEGIEVYRDMLDNSCRRLFNSDLNIFAAGVFEKYLENEISVEDAARMIDEKAKMIFNE